MGKLDVFKFKSFGCMDSVNNELLSNSCFQVIGSLQNNTQVFLVMSPQDFCMNKSLFHGFEFGIM